MMGAAYYVVLGIIVFLMMLNGYLRGTRTRYADAILGVLWFAVLGLGFYLFSWKQAALNILLSFVIGMALKPLASRIGARLNP